MSNFWQRTIFGLLFAGAILTAVFWHFFLFVFLFLGFVIISADELHLLLGNEKGKWINIASVAALFLLVAAYFYEYLPPMGLLSILIFPVILWGWAKWQKTTSQRMLKNWLWTTAYIGIGYSSLIILFFPPFSDYHYTHELVMVIFVTVWIYDTFAYLAGRWLGKHKMFPETSPGKTWEGFAGGLAFAIAGIIALSSLLKFLDIIQWIAFALVVVLSATAGDYFESKLKRRSNLKDSGSFLPGHGGALDRFDSILFAAPASVIFIFLLFL